MIEKKGDLISNELFNILNNIHEPLETKELEQNLKEKIKKETITRSKVFYRLNILRAEQKIKGKFVGPGKGVWIWWANSFNLSKEETGGKK